MKAITVTQELKDLNPKYFSVNLVGTIKSVSDLPNTFYSPTYEVGKRTDWYHTLNTSVHEADGFYDLIEPSYNPETERLGSIIFDVTNFTYTLTTISQEDIEKKIIRNSESIQKSLIQSELQAQVIADAQNYDDTTSLDNKDIFPMWQFPFNYTLDYKCKHFQNGELVLFKCVQSHTSQVDWKPDSVPALFTKVAYPGQILNWIQPTGAQDAYQIGAQVYHDNPNDSSNIWLYESKIDANTTEPGRDGTFDRWWDPLSVKP